MKKTEYIVRYIGAHSTGFRRVYEDEYGDQFVKIKGEIVAVGNPIYTWVDYEYYPKSI